MRRILLLAAFAFFASIPASISKTDVDTTQSKRISEADISKQLRKFSLIYRDILKNHYEEVDFETLIEAAIVGMMDTLDPYTRYFTADKMKDIKEHFRGDYEGVGVTVSNIDDTINIMNVVPDGPSFLAGIKVGDKILEIDGENATNITTEDVSLRLRGPKGSDVDIKVLRPDGKSTSLIKVYRGKIPDRSVNAAFMIEGTDVAYVSVTGFIQTTHNEFVDSLKELEKKGMKRLILDLRDNPGGYLSQAYKLADELIPKDTKMRAIVSTIGRNSAHNKIYYERIQGDYEDIPLIALCDGGSASGSEIVLGAIQDYDRGLIIGQPTYGKGLVQSQEENDDGSGYRVTHSRYYTPSGRCIQKDFDPDGSLPKIEYPDGKTMDDIISDLFETTDPDSLPPIYTTRIGRRALGGGGISPDYNVKNDTLSDLVVELRKERLFFRFARDFIYEDYSDFVGEYASDFATFKHKFEVDDSILDDFEDYAIFYGVEWKEDEFEYNKKYFKTKIKAEIARFFWQNNEYQTIFSDYYKEIKKALDLFPISEKLANAETEE